MDDVVEVRPARGKASPELVDDEREALADRRLGDVLDDVGVDRRACALERQQVGPGPRALGDLLKAAKDKDTSVRQNVLRALAPFGLDGKEAILQVITEALKDSNRDVRLAAGATARLKRVHVAGAGTMLAAALEKIAAIG